MSMAKHVPVLLKETIDNLVPKTGEIVVDATLGGGGHALALGEKIGTTGTLIGIDEDERALKETEKVLQGSLSCKICFHAGNFRKIDEILKTCKVKYADVILFDLGLSSIQLEMSGRGFSFKKHEPLLMTFAAHSAEDALTAYEIVNYWSKKDITEILYTYGEERFAPKIADAIVRAREKELIGYSDELAHIVELVAGAGKGKRPIHPATKTFQALRIAVNDELNALSEGLQKGLMHLNTGGRIGVISFHSLEDRIVKQFFKEQVMRKKMAIVTKKPITPSKEEIQKNGRARSAKLRIARKL